MVSFGNYLADTTSSINWYYEQSQIIRFEIITSVATGDTNGSEKLIDTMEAKFKITKTINPTCITGVQVERVRGKNGWTKLHQTEYTLNFLKEQKMEGARSVDTPMDPGTAKLLMELPRPGRIHQGIYQDFSNNCWCSDLVANSHSTRFGFFREFGQPFPPLRFW